MTQNLMPTHMLVSAQIRTGAQNGVVITVLRKGDPMSGSILQKINRLDGTVELLCQIWMDEERVWTPAMQPPVTDEKTADAFMAKEADMDPDLWLIEVEDKEGRSWFPGKIVDL